VKVYSLRETDQFTSDLRRIGDHLDRTTGDHAKSDEILRDFRAAVDALAEFPNRHVERRDLSEGIRMCIVRKKGVILFTIEEEDRVVRILRAFYGGEDYAALFHGENEN
jgi:plasmid stabilization system protein ParE